MKRIAWTTDIHLDFVEEHRKIDEFCQSVVALNPDVVLIGGDIAVARTLELWLGLLSRKIQRPIYFVLGNHDYYQSSIASVRSSVAKLCKQSSNLHWLSNSGIIELSPATALIGHDGWADGRLGNGIRSEVMLNDYFLIQELTDLAPLRRFAKLSEFGEQAAHYLRIQLLSAAPRFQNLILLTHVPPFKESCWHEGHISDDEFLPHFTCSAVGDMLFRLMPHFPECHLTVLCGHTHGQGKVTMLPNLCVKTGGAEYGKPKVNELIHFE
jgi:3',5'-cyclic-AMP phosphodiesterase